MLREIIGIRWRELGFSGISQYVTSLIRYDLLLGGPHTFFRGGDCTPEMCRSLDLETIKLFILNYRPRTLGSSASPLMALCARRRGLLMASLIHCPPSWLCGGALWLLCSLRLPTGMESLR